MESIKKFYEIYRKGAFPRGVGTQAYRAINFLHQPTGGKIVTKARILEIVGDHIETSNDPLSLIDELILTFLNDVRNHSEIIRHYNMIRELTLIYKNYINNIESGEPELGIKRGRQRISIAVKSHLDSKVPVKVIEEHLIPVKVLRDRLLEECYSKEKVREIMLRDVKCVWITKAEDSRIPVEYRSDAPSGSDRYALAGIEIYPELVKFLPAMLSKTI